MELLADPVVPNKFFGDQPRTRREKNATVAYDIDT